MKKNIEKIRNDLYVKKSMGGTYEVVYPMKDNEGNKIKGNLKKVLLSDIKGTLHMLLIVGILLMMLLPGAQNIKVQCEENMKHVYDNACEYCAKGVFGNPDFVEIPNMNLTDQPINFTKEGDG